MTRLSTLCVTAVVAVLATTAGARAQDVVRTFDWSEAVSSQPTDAAVELDVDEHGRLHVRRAGEGRHVVRVMTVDQPGVTRPCFALRLRAQGRRIDEPVVLRMDTWLPDGGPYFSRTAGDSGPMRPLTDEAPRRIALPMTLSGDARPTRIALSVVFDGAGEVVLGPPELIEASHPAVLTSPEGAWWSSRAGGLIGGIGGGAFGLFCGVLGLLSGLGRGREPMMKVMLALCLLGVATAGVGVLALILGQPYAVWFPLVLLGGLVAVVCGGMRPILYRSRRQAELRAMQAADAGGG